MPESDLPTQLRALRAKLGINQAELARRLGVTPSTVARWESGASTPRAGIETIVAAAMRAPAAPLGAVMGAFLGGVGGPPGILAGAAIGALGGLTITKLLRNAARLGLSAEQAAEFAPPSVQPLVRKAAEMGLSTAQVADLLDPSIDPTDPSTQADQEEAQSGGKKEK